MEHDTVIKAEEGSASYTVYWYHPTTGAAVTPTVATWKLTDGAGTVINGRTAVPIVTPSTSNTIVLAGDDLAIQDNANLSEKRVLTVFGNAADIAIPIVVSIDLWVENLDATT